MPEFAVRKRSPAPALSRRPSLAMHAGQCTICRHPQRADLEREFLDWRSPRDIAREYGLGSHTTVYRHAHALGLFDRRHRTLRFALGRLIEQVGDVKPTAASIVSAIRLLAKLNTRQKWTEEADDSQAEDAPDSSLPAEPQNGPLSVVAARESGEADKDGWPLRLSLQWRGQSCPRRTKQPSPPPLRSPPPRAPSRGKRTATMQPRIPMRKPITTVRQSPSRRASALAADFSGASVVHPPFFVASGQSKAAGFPHDP
jgi:hypothetical protein